MRTQLSPLLRVGLRAFASSRSPFRIVLSLLVLLPLAISASAQNATPPRPNILWIFGDDLGPDLACYGTPAVSTPNLDDFAKQGIRYTRAYTTAPVCSPSRSAMMTGMYQTTIGAHHHRSHRDDNYQLPAPVRTLTDLFRDAGYFTSNIRTIAPNFRASGKTDFNFTFPKPFDGEDFAELKTKQPFYAQINFSEPHRGNTWPQARKRPNPVDPAKVQLPPYYPDHPLVRYDYANYLDAIQQLDAKVGQVLKMLENDGLARNTIVIFLGDNGRAHVRDKQWCYDGGAHIPLIIRFPDGRRADTVNDDLVSAIDLTATSLHLANIPVPTYMQGRPLFAPDYKPREFVVVARDRCDETVDRIRRVATKDFAYIRNFRSDLPYTQPNAYKERQYPVLALMKQLHAEGKLTPAQQLFMAPTKPEEELYDLRADPHEIHNLAKNPNHAPKLNELRATLDQWIKDTHDQGATPET